MDALKKFFKDLLLDKETGEISKTKLGVILEALVSILSVKGVIDKDTAYIIGISLTPILGAGIADRIKRKG